MAGISKCRRSSARPRSSSTARAATRARAQVARAGRSTRPITLERGVTHDLEFEQWANKVWNFGAGLGAEVSLDGLPQGHHHRGLQRGRPARDRLQGLPLLGLGVPVAARPRRERERRRDPAHQARERGVRARLRGARALRAELRRAVVGRERHARHHPAARPPRRRRDAGRRPSCACRPARTRRRCSRLATGSARRAGDGAARPLRGPHRRARGRRGRRRGR